MSFAAKHFLTRLSYLILLAALFSAGACLTTAAQGGVGSTRGLPGTSDGIYSIQGHIYFPIEPSAGKRLRIRLTSTDLVDQTTMSDDNGVFLFSRIPAGHYTVTVDGGQEFDTATETVFIDRGGLIASVTINLNVKGAADDFARIPKEARDAYAKGTEAAAKGDNKKAAEELSRAVTLYPQFSQALSELGVQYLKLGQADKAAESLQAALKLAPQDVPGRLSYGIALMNLKKFAEAETELRQVLTKNSAIPTAHMYLGIVLLSTSRDEKTKQYDMARYTEAQKEFEVAVQTGKDEVAMAHRYLGGIYAGNRDYKRAADELETYLKLVPKAPDAERMKNAIKELRSK